MSKRRAAGSGALLKWRKDGQVVGWIGVADLGVVDGKRCRQKVYGKTQAEVQKRLADILHKKEDGTLPKPGRLTVEAWLKTWLAGVHKRPRTFEHYELVVRKHIVPLIGSKPLAKLTASDVERLMAAKLAGGLSPRSVHHVRAVLRNALRKAVRDRLISHNVAAEADAPDVPMVEMQTLTPEQVKVFLGAVTGRRLEALYVTTLALGLRRGEVLGLRWSDINLDAGTLRVSRALQWIRPIGQRRSEPALVEPKSRTSRRALSLPSVALESLRAHRRRWADEKLRLGDRYLNEWDLVFVGPQGEPLNPKTIWSEFHEEILVGAGLPLIRFHDLRHSCASLLLLAGVPARMVQEILGHSSIGLTLGTYSHVLPGLREQAVRAQNAMLGG
ncbi:MAG: tyrosine-type recombinase/integrase [Candidatus Dormibacterales bacterium]